MKLLETEKMNTGTRISYIRLRHRNGTTNRVEAYVTKYPSWILIIGGIGRNWLN